MKYESVIGLEIHTQLQTNTKIFCSCSTQFGSVQNTQTCPVCIGMPGVLPVLNRNVIKFAMMTALALNCSIPSYNRFARKNYFYPDLPKGYQISQYELPLAAEGFVEIVVNGKKRHIGLTRAHLEEDAGKNIHSESSPYSLVDLNRAGVPLLEIVTEPDLRTPEEAAAFMRKLRTIVRYLGVCDGNMEQGSMRCDANISVRPVGQSQLGTKTEVKNVNSFKFLQKAIEYEIKRQIQVIESGGSVVQETRLWDSTRNITESMRSKEEAHDYRYFPEPDLVPVEIGRKEIDEIRAEMPELPDEKRERYISSFNLPEHDAEFISSEKAMVEWFEKALKEGGQPKPLSNWMMGELTKLLNDDNCLFEDCPVKPKQLVDMLTLIDNGTISGSAAKKVFKKVYQSGKDPESIVKENGLAQISDESQIEEIVDNILKKNPEEVERLKKGEKKLQGFFVGQVMKATKGKGNPRLINEILKKKLV